MDDFNRFAALMPEPMLLVSSHGDVLAANQQVGRLLGGNPASDLVGVNLLQLDADRLDATTSWLRACARSRGLLPTSLRLPRTNGDGLECRAAGGVYRPASGDQPALLLVRLTPKQKAVDSFLALNLRIEELSAEVARRRRAEVELRAQQEWLSVTLHSIGDAVIATDEVGRVIFMNPVAERLTGWSQAEATGRHLDEVFVIVNEHTLETVESPVAKVLRAGTVVGLANHTILLARDGSELPIDDSGAPIRDEHGRIIGVVLVFHDIAERRALERELEARNRNLVEADQRKDEFLAMLAHELRNPLAPLGSGIEVLKTGAPPPGGLDHLTEMMSRQLQHLTELVNDLLDVSRITRGRIELNRQQLVLQTVLTHALEMVDRQMTERRHRLTMELPDEDMLVDGDATRLAQVFSNLLSNAAKFTDPEGEISLACGRQAATWVVRLTDNGAGIAPEFLSRIFDLFTQADRSLERSQGGLGLGLTVARQVVEMHGGTIEAFSDGIGRGSEFVVTLPALERARRQPDDEQASAAETRSVKSPKRVLVVDDNRDAADTLAMLLELWGHQVQIAGDGLTAMELGEAFDPHVVLLDLGLPGLDGFEVARRMRSHQRLRHVHLVAITGYGRSEDRHDARDAGFDDHLTKPVEPDVLARLIDGS